MHRRFILLLETPAGLQRIEIRNAQPENVLGEVDAVLFTGHNGDIWALDTGDEISQLGELVAQYQQLLIPGEKYHLLWPGGEIDMWEWGAKSEWAGKELKARAAGSRDSQILVITARNVLSFTAKEEEIPWPERKEVEKRGSGFAYMNDREAEWRRKQSLVIDPKGFCTDKCRLLVVGLRSVRNLSGL